MVTVGDRGAVDAGHDGPVARVAGPFGERPGSAPVSQQVHLRPAGAARCGGRDLLEGVAGDHRDRHDRADPGRGPGGGPLALVGREALHGGRRDEHRSRDRHAQHRGRGLDARDVAQDMGAEPEPTPRREVGGPGDPVRRPPVDVLGRDRVEARRGELLEAGQVHAAACPVGRLGSGGHRRSVAHRGPPGATPAARPWLREPRPGARRRTPCVGGSGATTPGRGRAPYAPEPKRRVRSRASRPARR